jgi:futalosine hydrolase
MNVLICAATASETALLRDRLGSMAGIRIIETGVGPVNAAHAVTLALSQETPAQIVMCGIAGAYPTSGLQIGDVVCAECEIYGDLGAESAQGFLSMAALGFAVVSGSTPLFNELPMSIFPVARRERFVTLSTCTGTHDTALVIAARTGGAVENMEGAAVAHVALLHGIAVGEVRGISNLVTNRDKSSWELAKAATAAQQAVIDWIMRR